MEIVFELESWSKSTVPASGRGDCLHPDWHGLRARLSASHDVRGALAQGKMDEAGMAGGSFDKQAARQIGAFEAELAGVNPIDSVNRNPGEDIDNAVAGISRTGDRG